MNYSIGRAGADSRCCQPADPPWSWHDYTDDGHAGVTELEAWLETLSPWLKAHELGRIDALMEAAERGELEDTGDERTTIKPIREDPEIYEIRHKTLTKPLRFYHGEPAEAPDALIAVHRHIKTTGRDQQLHIEFAADRYLAGRPTRWGML